MLKLFTGKATWEALTRAGTRMSGISGTSVQMKQVYFLNKSLAQLETMKSLKPDAKEIVAAIDVLNRCNVEINHAMQGKVLESEGPSFNRRP